MGGTMTIYDRLATARTPFRVFCVAVVLSTASSLPFSVKADPFEGPTFRKGMWRFERTLELVLYAPTIRFLLLKQETKRCVDPTKSMKGTFASPNVGNCRSLKPKKINNKYVFSSRCDYM